MPAAGSIRRSMTPPLQQRGVEAVAGVGEVGLRGGGPEAGVDADEEQPQVGPEQVGHLRVAERLELGPREAAAFGHGGQPVTYREPPSGQ